MTLQAFRIDEIAKIYKGKLIYSIIKYNNQCEGFKALVENKYLTALDLSNCSFDNDILVDIVDYLDTEKQKYEEISDKNQEIIDIIADRLTENIVKEGKDLPNDLEKCRFIFEYILKTFNYDFTSKKYHRNIPFGEDYNFEFYNGVPISKSYKGLLVTKTGLSDNIANLMVYLGNQLGISIGTLSCECYGDTYILNTINIDGNVSYMDITSVLVGRCCIDDACLVDRSKLLRYATFNYIEEEGITREMDFNYPYDFSNIIEQEKSLLPQIETSEEKIIVKEKIAG